jgi:hypothetical protein
MTRTFGALVRAVTIVSVAMLTSNAAFAQERTAKQCRDEWRANEADFKARKIKEKDYVKDCRAGTATAPTPAAAAPAAPPATPAVAAAGHKTAKACRDEWRANEADFKARKIKESDYVKDCRAGTATAQPAAAPAPRATTAAAPPAEAPAAAPPPARKPAPTLAAAPTGANQFASEAQAKARCRSDVVVWVNTDSGIYHFSGHKDYGATKQGAYMCEKDALAAGDRAAKNEKHP